VGQKAADELLGIEGLRLRSVIIFSVPVAKIDLAVVDSAEFQAGNFLVDILDTGDSRIEFFRRKGTIQPYYTPMAEKFDKRFVQPQGYWVANRVTMLVLGYNTRLVKAAEAPRRYEAARSKVEGSNVTGARRLSMAYGVDGILG